MSLARVLASLVTLSLSVAVLGGTAGPAAGVDEQPFVFEGQQQGAWPNPCRDIPGYFEESRTETPTPGGEGLVDIIVVCQPAPPGYFTAVGSRFRLPCPVSRFQPDAGQTYCLLAPVGFYVDRRGASEAMKCPPGTTTESTASASVDDCVVVDTTPPVVTAATDRDPNPAGWFRAPVTVTWTAEDEVDGLLPAPPPVIVDSEGGNQSATSEVACDAAGNCAAGVLDGISLDRTAPELSGATVGSANHAGWFDAPVTVSWTCSDALSGVEECSEPVEIGEGADQSVTGIAVDVAGNSTEMTMGVVAGIFLGRPKHGVKSRSSK